MPLGLAQDSRVMINLQWEYLPCPPFLATAAFRGRMCLRGTGGETSLARLSRLWVALSYLVLGLQSDFFYLIFGS